MADILPAFPLGLIAFPGEELNLHIFEPRYKQLINECVERDKTFALYPFFEDKETYLATEMKVVEVVKRHAGGEMDIRTKGIDLLKVDRLYDKHPRKLYPGIEYLRLSWSDDNGIEDLNKEIIDGLTSMYKYMKITNIKLKSPKAFRTYQIAHKVGFSVDQELHFLSLKKESDRQKYMMGHLVSMLPILREMDLLRERALLNGQFKKVNPSF